MEFASRALSEPETRYAQIVKEVLALVYACKKFSDYVLGKNILLETHHKHLMPLLGNKSLNALPPRVLRFCIRLMRFQYSISHVPGKTFYIPDTLSRAPLNTPDANGVEKDTEMFLQAVIVVPASKDYLEDYRKAQSKDTVCSNQWNFAGQAGPVIDS